MIKDIIKEVMKSADLESLQCLAAARMVISVCESEDIQSMMRKFRKAFDGAPAGFLDSQWKWLRRTAKRKLDQIGIPKKIIAIILEKLWPISFEVFKWIFYHTEDIGIDCSSKFCWTPHLSIDYEKTARILIKNKTLDRKTRFKLACFYCFEHEVRSLWDTLNLFERRKFFSRGNLKKFNQNPIVLYWTYYIQEVPIDHWKSKTLNYTQLFKYAIEDGYLNPTMFFLRKMKKQLRNRMIENCFYIHLWKLDNPDCIVRDHLVIACNLESKLSPNYPGIPISRMIRLIFLYFLEWPMQKHFMAFVNRMRCYINDIRFGELLQGIFEKDHRCFRDFDYKKLFETFWQQSSEANKTYVNTNSLVGFGMLIKFVKKHFGFVFDETSFGLKAKFRAVILHREFAENDTYFDKDNVKFFKFLVRERVATWSYIDGLSRNRFVNFSLPEFGIPFFRVPFGELMYLMDVISKAI